MSCLMIIGMQLKAQNSKFSLGVMSSLDFYNPKYDDTAKVFTIQKTQAYRYGINIQYNFNEKLSIRSGLNYSIAKIKIVHLQKTNSIYGDLIQNDSITLFNWNIPIIVRYTMFTDGNFKIIPSLGYVISFMKGTKINDLKFPSYINPDTEYKSILHSAQFNLGFEYLIKNKITISFEPYINWNLSEIDSHLFKKNSICLGEILSINYKF